MGVNNYTYGKNGQQLTESFEQCRLVAYRPTSNDVWTIGWGHTGPEVVEGLTWTQAKADAQVEIDYSLAQACVNANVTIPISQDENDALVDLAFNIGLNAFRTSTLLRDLNAGNIAAAIAQFDVWDHQAGKVLAGLLRRRQQETALFKQGEQPPTAA
jgi:lysozyme